MKFLENWTILDIMGKGGPTVRANSPKPRKDIVSQDKLLEIA